MNYQKLKKHIIALATLPENKSPLVSAYFDLRLPRGRLDSDFHAWAELTASGFRGSQRHDFDDAVDEIFDYLTSKPEARSVAIFSRWGEYPMLLPLTFEVPLETQFHVGELPVIYPLVELKDRFNRFVLVVTNSESARIFEINLGEVSETLLAERPELRERLGREWTREHYQNHRKQRDQQFVKEKVAVIERLMAKRGHNTLLLAGEPRFVKRLRGALPKHLEARVAAEIRTGVREHTLPQVIDEAIHSFIEQEARQSHSAVQMLADAVRRGGLAVIGLQPSLDALEAGQADLLVLSNQLPGSDREKLVRAASRHDTSIETVSGNVMLEQNGGVGCLLRYLTPPAASQRSAA
jgi:ribosomal protein L30E/protein required for attachment to host cells